MKNSMSFGGLALLFVFLAIGTLTLLYGCLKNSPVIEPRTIWMTYRDGPVPTGENLYFDSSLAAQSGHIHAKKYEMYAFVDITGHFVFQSDSVTQLLLSESIRQCRQSFADAFRLGVLRQVDSLGHSENHRLACTFKPKYIVFLLTLKDRSSEGRNDGRSESDYGAVIPVVDVFSAEKSVENLAQTATIVAKPNSLREPSRTGPKLDFWRDTSFTVIEEFERQHGIDPPNVP